MKQTNTPNDQSVKKATEAVKLLFDETGAKTSNTQAKINEVKLQVMELTESVQKTNNNYTLGENYVKGEFIGEVMLLNLN
ncbi:hypothetical protein ACHCPG_001025 [Enterococcus hirae]